MLFKKVPPIAAKIALITGITIIGCGYFISPFTEIVEAIHEFHFPGAGPLCYWYRYYWYLVNLNL